MIQAELSKEEWPYRWFWRKVLPERNGMPCRVTARGKLNNIRVEFPDGFVTITSRFAVRKRSPQKSVVITLERRSR
jgi:hypothetical protein